MSEASVCKTCDGTRIVVTGGAFTKLCPDCNGTGTTQQPAQPDWREFTDTQRLDWLMLNCGMPGVSRSVIDEAIARDEFFRRKA